MSDPNLFKQYVPTPPTTVNVPTYAQSLIGGSGITGSIYGGQIPTMTTQAPVPDIPKSQDRGFGSDLFSSLGTLGKRTLELGGALGKAIDPTGGAFRNFLRGERGREMFDPQSIVGAVVGATAPDMTAGQRLGTAFTPVGNVFSEFQDVLTPIQAEVIGRTGFGSQAMTNSGKTYEEISKGYREQGYNWLESAEKARQEHDVKALDISKDWIGSAPEWMQTPLNFVVPEKITPYGAGEFVLDPLIFLPLGKGGSAAGKAAKLNKAKQAPKLFDDPIKTLENQWKKWDDLDAQVTANTELRIGFESAQPLLLKASEIPKRGSKEWVEYHTKIDNLIDQDTVVKNQIIKKELNKTKPTDNIVDDIGSEVPAGQPRTGTKQIQDFTNEEKIVVGERLSSGINVSNTGKMERLRNWLGGVVGDNDLYGLGRLGLPTTIQRRVQAAVKPVMAKTREIMKNGRTKGQAEANRIEAEMAAAFGDEIVIVNGVETVPRLRGVDADSKKLKQYFNEAGEEVNPVAKTEFVDGVEVVTEYLPPTIGDIARRLPVYWDRLTVDQQQFFVGLRSRTKKYDDYIQSEGFLDDIGSAPDILRTADETSGFYVPRGTAKKLSEGKNVFEIPNPKVRRKGVGKGNLEVFEQTFDNQSSGVHWVGEAGETLEYTKLSQSIGEHIEGVHTNIAKNYRAKVLGNMRLDGKKIPTAYKGFLEKALKEGKLDSALAIPFEKIPRIREGLIKLQALKVLDDKLVKKIDDFADNPFADPDEITELIAEIRASLNAAGRRKLNKQDKANVNAIIKDVKKDLTNLPTELKKSIRQIQTTFKDDFERYNQIEFQGIQGQQWIDDAAEEMNKIIKNDPTIKTPKQSNEAIKALNGIMRGLGATFDMSANGITLLFGAWRNPRAWSKALAANFQSLYNPHVLGNRIKAMNKKLMDEHGITLDDMIDNGLHISSGEFEFAIAQAENMSVFGRLSRGIGEKRPFKEFNRAFGNAGDVMRMEMAANELKRLKGRTNKTTAQIIADGEMREITNVVNRVTGYTDEVFAGEWGEWFLFAPRFFQSRIDNLLEGLYGSARFAGSPFGVHTTLSQRIAAQNLAAMVGAATTMTVLLNEALGNETEFKPFREITEYKTVGGKKIAKKKWIPEPNFMTIRAGGRDWNLFGAQMQLARLFAGVGSSAYEKDPEGVLAAGRGVSSPIVARLWDLWTGKTFMGESTDVLNDPKTALLNLGEQMIPFAMQDMKLNIADAVDTAQKEGIGKGVVKGVVGVGADFLGTPQNPITMGDLLQDVATDTFGKPYSDLESYEKDVIRVVIESKVTPFQEEARKRISDAREYFDQIDELNKERIDRLRELGNSTATGYKLMNEYYKINSEISTKKRAIAPEYESSSDDLNDPDPNKRALAEYYSLIDHAKTDAGNFDGNLYSALKQRFMAKLTPEQKLYILRNTNKSPVPMNLIQKMLIVGEESGRKEYQELITSQRARLQALGDREDLKQISNDIFFANTKRVE